MNESSEPILLSFEAHRRAMKGLPPVVPPQAEPTPPVPRYRYTRKRWHTLMGLIDGLGERLFNLFPQAKQPAEPPRRILLIQLDHLGDAMLTTPMLGALRWHYPDAEIEVLASESCAEVFQRHADVKQVWVCRRNRLSRSVRTGWMGAMLYWGLKLRRQKYDLAFDVRGELPHALLMWLSGAKRRIGWAAGGGGFLLSDSVAYLPGRHETDSRMALLECADIPTNQYPGGQTPVFEPSWSAMHRMATRVHSFTWKEEVLFVLHIGAGSAAKRWPVPNWRELVRRLRSEYKARVILVGSHDDQEQAKRITRWAENARVVNWTGQTTLEELAALVRMSDVFIGCDSGPAHVAAAGGTPSVVLFSGTNDAEQWRPWGPHVSVLKHEVACSPCHTQDCPVTGHPCMTDLRPSDVMQAVHQHLATHHTATRRAVAA